MASSAVDITNQLLLNQLILKILAPHLAHALLHR